MRTFLFFLLIFNLFSSCKSSSDKRKEALADYDMLPVPIDSTVLYFDTKPDYKDTTANAVTAFVNAWYSKILFTFKEPILKGYHGNKEIYRFTWLRSFHHPVSIRLEKQGDRILLFTKVFSGAGGYEPGELIVDKITEVTPQEYNTLISKVEETRFWSLPTGIEDSSNDGAEWIVEIAKNRSYHMVTRRTPFDEQFGNYRIIGEYLISLAKLDKKETENIY